MLVVTQMTLFPEIYFSYQTFLLGPTPAFTAQGKPSKSSLRPPPLPTPSLLSHLVENSF